MHCPGCGNKKIEILEKAETYKICRCLQCDLFFSDASVFPDRKWYEKTLGDKTAMVRTQVWLKWQEQIYSQLLKRKGYGRMLLDVGCGDGEFIRRAQEKGYKVTGIDFNKILISKVKRMGLEVYSMSLEQFGKRFPKRTFDIITFFEVLEHTDNPGHFLTLVGSMLKPGGNIVLSVPNRDRFRFGFNKYPKWDRPPHHFTWWSVDVLKNFLRLRGFKILEFRVFQKTIRFRFQQEGESRNKDSFFLTQLSLSRKLKYLFWRKIVSLIIFKVFKKKTVEMRVKTKGPYLYAHAVYLK